MTASMMMYARPELAAAHARFWTCLRGHLEARGIKAPQELNQTAPEFEIWEDPALVFSQTCGMPFRTRLHPNVQLVATPDYGIEGCAAGYYRSAIVVRAADTRHDLRAFSRARLAYNMAHSQSGFSAIYTHTAGAGFWFADRIARGAHLSSAAMVAEGAADIAALDAQTWRLIQRFEPFATQLRVLEWTDPTPALPYITGAAQDAGIIRACLHDTLRDVDKADLLTLDLKGLVDIPPSAYLAVPNPPADAAG